MFHELRISVITARRSLVSKGIFQELVPLAEREYLPSTFSCGDKRRLEGEKNMNFQVPRDREDFSLWHLNR